MKIRAVYLLLIPLFLAGCGASTYESRAGLTPLEAPVALAGSNLDDPAVKKACDPMLLFVSQPQTPEEIQKRISAIPLTNSIAQLFVSADAEALKKEFEKHTSYIERALVIFKSQVEAGDTTDSTGEVKKYLGYSRQCFANFVQLSKTAPKNPLTSGAPVAPPVDAQAAIQPTAVAPAGEVPADSSTTSQTTTSTTGMPQTMGTPASNVPPAPSTDSGATNASTANASDELKRYAQHFDSVSTLVESALEKTKGSTVTDNTIIAMGTSEIEKAIALHTSYSAVPSQFISVNAKMTGSLNTLLRAFTELRSANEVRTPEKYDIAIKTMDEGRSAFGANMIEFGEKLKAIGEGRAPM